MSARLCCPSVVIINVPQTLTIKYVPGGILLQSPYYAYPVLNFGNHDNVQYTVPHKLTRKARNLHRNELYCVRFCKNLPTDGLIL